MDTLRPLSCSSSGLSHLLSWPISLKRGPAINTTGIVNVVTNDGENSNIGPIPKTSGGAAEDSTHFTDLRKILRDVHHERLAPDAVIIVIIAVLRRVALTIPLLPLSLSIVPCLAAADDASSQQRIHRAADTR